MKCTCEFSRVTMSGHCLDCGGQKEFVIVSAYTLHLLLPFGFRLVIDLLRSKKTGEQHGK